MRISTKGQYALKMLLDLAEHGQGEFIALKEIAERQNISKKYLEAIVALLNSSNLLQTNRGAQGGYRLAKTPDQYTVGQILRITEGSLSPIAQLTHPSEENNFCRTLPVWQGLEKVITAYLDDITLQSILDNSPSKKWDFYSI